DTRGDLGEWGSKKFAATFQYAIRYPDVRCLAGEPCAKLPPKLHPIDPPQIVGDAPISIQERLTKQLS
ncbi:MAG TPA: hypothetical protein VM260_25545, partial [Pirellula sp.]|nr:hypothetical protein [Pirellula sp.]